MALATTLLWYKSIILVFILHPVSWKTNFGRIKKTLFGYIFDQKCNSFLMNKHATTKLIEINAVNNRRAAARHWIVMKLSQLVWTIIPFAIWWWCKAFISLSAYQLYLISVGLVLEIQTTAIWTEAFGVNTQPISYLTNLFWQDQSYRMSHSIGFIKSDTRFERFFLSIMHTVAMWLRVPFVCAVVSCRNVFCWQRKKKNISLISFFRHSGRRFWASSFC